MNALKKSEERREAKTSRSQAVFKFTPWEQFSGAFGFCARDIAMTEHVLIRDTIILLKCFNEENEGLQLGLSHKMLTKIAHDADTDPVFIHVGGFGVRPFNLLDPAWADLDLSVRFAFSAIID